MADSDVPGSPAADRDGALWPLGQPATAAWIKQATSPGLTIAAAIPPLFARYATIVVPEEDLERDARTLVQVLAAGTAEQPWWLGYLDTGGDDVVFPDAPRVTIYSGWSYVLAQAGPDQALSWRDATSARKGVPPDLIWPEDRSWLLSTLWDDDWRCLGGSSAIVEAILQAVGLDAREVLPDDDATPPGRVAR